MKKKYYFKIDENNVIIDVTSFKTEGYLVIEVEELPRDILNGRYKIENGEIVWMGEPEPIPEIDEIETVDEEKLNKHL